MRRSVKTILLLIVLVVIGAAVLRLGHDYFMRTAYPLGYREIVEEEARTQGVDPALVYAVMKAESNFDPDATSHAGARGLMQITDETFLWIKSKIAPGEEITFDDLFDPAVNIRFGTYLLATCLARYDGDFSTAAAAYHSGMGLVDSLLQKAEYSADGKTLTAFPYEQMNLYVHKVNKNYQKYLALYAQDEGV